MQILIVTQGEWGERIETHLRQTAPPGWQIETWRGPPTLPAVLDEPEAFLPDALPQADLLLVLTESVGLTDLSPDIAQLCGAKAVMVPIDKRPWARPGLVRQVKARLDELGIACVFPKPFCSLVPRPAQHELIRQFAQRYGRPELVCTVDDRAADGERSIASCEILRETPCGNTRYIVERLVGVPADIAPEQAGLLHHYYPCWGGMGVDPVQGTHTLLHIAATMAQKSVERALEGTGKDGG